MTVRAGQLREGSLVLHPFRGGAEGDKEQFEFAQPRMTQRVSPLGQHRLQSPHKDQRELLADLSFGTRAAHLAVFDRLDQSQRLRGSIARRDVEVLPHHVDEVVAREPLEVCHQAMVSTSPHTSRTNT